MSVSIEAIKELRAKTGVSVAECKKALTEAAGDMAKAEDVLRSRGAAVAAKKADRGLGAGKIGTYVHSDGSFGSLVELACETDFVAKNEEFVSLANDLAMQVAAFDPADQATLLALPFIKDQSVTVDAAIKSRVQKFGERIELVRFARLAVGN